MCDLFVLQVINCGLVSQFPVHPLPIGKSSSSEGHSESKEDPKLRRGYCQLTHRVRGKKLHAEQSLRGSVYKSKRKGQTISESDEELTATKVVGRYSKVTTVITLMVAESLTAAFVNASVFTLVF